MTATPPAATTTDGPPQPWHTVSLTDVFSLQGVDERQGLTSAEAEERRQRSGPNRLAAAKTEPRWHAFLRQFRDPMQIVLLIAGIGSLYPIKQYGTGVVILLLT